MVACPDVVLAIKLSPPDVSVSRGAERTPLTRTGDGEILEGLPDVNN